MGAVQRFTLPRVPRVSLRTDVLMRVRMEDFEIGGKKRNDRRDLRSIRSSREMQQRGESNCASS